MIQSPEREAVASCASEVLLLHAALGDGYVSPLPAAEGLVFTSAVNPESHERLRAAEKAFTAWYDVQLQPDREELERLEESCRPEKKAGRRESEYTPGPFGHDPTQDKAKLKALREKLALQPNVTWREHHFHKSSLLELLTKSACGAMTYVDEHGFRLAASMCSPWALAADMSLLSLCKGSADSALIRSSATGGASIHSLKGDYAPAFNYFCSAQHEDVEAVGERIASGASGRPARGKAIVIPVKTRSYPTPAFSVETLLLAMKAVYAKGRLRPEEKLQVVWESDDLRAAWLSFLDLPVEAYVEHEPTKADWDTYDDMPATIRTIALFASRAIQTHAILRSLETSPKADVTLTWGMLEVAQQFARLIFQVSSGEEKLARRREGAKKAIESFKSHDKLRQAEQTLLKAIQDSPGHRLPRTAVRTIQGLTNGLLDELVKLGKVVELVTETKGDKVTRHYTLKESVSLEPEEATAELEAAQEAFGQDPDQVSRQDADIALTELKRKATFNFIKYRVPAVPITSMTPAQIAAIPRILQEWPEEAQLRGTKDCPEPAGVVEEDTDEAYPVTPGAICLWLRKNADDKDHLNWRAASGLGFVETWGEPD